MFERPVVEADTTVACADALVASIAEERQAVARRLAHVAAWADLHHPDADLPAHAQTNEPGQARAGKFRHRCRARLGADGTPEVSAYAGVELGMLLQTSTRSAELLLGEVLDLRHRLPRHWAAVQTGTLDGWKARQVARLTRTLTFEQATWLDTQVIDAVLGLPWGRAKTVVEAKVIAADPAAHRARLQDDENRPYVSTRRKSTAAAGIRTLIARGPAGDIARLEAMIAHLAALMKTAGDPDPADTRRAKALAMLANPALTCLYLTQTHAHAHHTNSQPEAEPVPEPESEPDRGPASAVELAVAFGQVLTGLGAKAADRLRPRSVLYLHLAAEALEGTSGTGVARVEAPVAAGPISLDQLKAWLGTDRVEIRPVLDPTDQEPVDAHEIPHHLREAQHLLTPFEIFPYGTHPARATDLDHTKPYIPPDQGGPPGQTATDNLGPLGRRHHLAKTFAGFTVHQPMTGCYFWKTPTGHWYHEPSRV